MNSNSKGKLPASDSNGATRSDAAPVLKRGSLVRIGDALRLINGHAFKPSEWKKTGLPIVRIQNLNNPDAPFNYYEGQLPEKFLLHDGDLLFAWSGTPGTSFGAHIWRGGKAWLNQHIFKVHFDENRFDKRYLQLAINRNLAEYIGAAHGGAGLAHITKGRFEESSLPCPPLDEQKCIVAEIEKQFTRLDAGVASLKRVQTALKRYRASVLKAACEGRLVPIEAELARKENREYETGEQLLQRILKQRREKWSGKGRYKEPRNPQPASTDELPEGWTWASWDQVGFSQNGRPFKSAEYQPSGFKLLRPGNLHISGKVVWTSDNTRYVPQHRADENLDLIVRGRELVMNLTAQSLRDEFLGRVCLTSKGEECLLNQRLARLTSIIVSPDFALCLLKAWRFRRFVDDLNTGSLIQHMFTSQLARFTFPLPPLAEQERIVTELDRRLSVIEHVELVCVKNVEASTHVRGSILTQAFHNTLHAVEKK